jgi:hypothetical protein
VNLEACYETTERLRKPESGTGEDVTVLLTWGSPQGIPLEGPGISGKSDPTDRSDGQEAVRDFRGDRLHRRMNFCRNRQRGPVVEENLGQAKGSEARVQRREGRYETANKAPEE